MKRKIKGGRFMPASTKKEQTDFLEEDKLVK